MPEKTPCSVSKVVSILKTSNIPKERLEDKNYELKGGICKDTRYGWVSWGPHFEVLNVSTGEKIAGWRFGTSRIELGTTVLCAVELPSTDGPLSVGQFVVGLEWEFVEGMVCIFDSQCSRLLRAIQIPERVISLSVVDGGTGGCEGRYPLPGLLSSMSGIVAAGLEGGKVLLIDLCRISSDELLTSWFSDDREEVRDELCPCQLVPINRNDNESEKLEVKRAEAARTGNHLSLLLNETAFVLDNFWLMGPAGENRVLFQKQRVAVTSLLYVPRIASLVVGFNFSCFQIWNLMHLKLNFTSSLLGDPLPVIHLGFQEPSDDPRNFCYLWAVHSCTDSYPSSSNPIGFMYALCYDSKEWVDGYGYLYQDYQSCSVRFEYELPNDCTDSITSSRCVSFHTLSNATPIQRSLLEDDYDEAGLENNLSLCLFMWEVYGSTGKPHSTFFSLFDLDQWYKDQMPHNVLDVDEDPAPCYLAMFSLDDVKQNASQSSTGSNPLLDIRIDPKSVAQFKSFQSLEEHFHPAALSFVSVCLLGQEVVFVDHPGVQRHVLMQMEREGPLSILHPTKLFRHCLNIGLKPILSEITSTLVSSISEQRDFLLSVALENQMLGFLFHCAAEWSSGAQSVAGCSLYVLLQWAWQRATTLKQEADTICVPLFDHSVRRLCRNESGNLESCVNQLHHLATLFTGINSDYTFPDMDLIKDLEQKTNSLQLAALYFEVVQWFCNLGLLPEFPEEEIVKEEIWFQKVPYPVTKLVKIYQKRRKELEQLSVKSNTEVRLFIDELLQHENEAEKLKSLWREDGGSGSYPPPSLQSLLGTYQVDGIETRIKHSIVIYVFLDLAALLDNNKYGKAIDYFIKFPSAFCMSPSIIKVTQAFWLLDHKNFEEALDMVLDPLVAPADLQPWQHRYIVQAFLCQGHESKALDYFSVRKLPVSTVEDIRLKMTLLVVNRQITEAYHFLRQHQNEDNYHILLNHFFGDCRRVNGLGMVLKLFLTPMEEDAFMKFLDSCQHSKAEDMHIVYYLMRSRIIEAIDANEKIRLQDTHRQYPGGRCVRDILVNGYSKTLPNVTRQLAQYCAKEKKAFKNWRQVNRPTPLSVDINQGSSQSVCYKSSLIRATFEKARETWFLPLTSSHCTPVSKEKENSDGASLQNMPFLCIPQDGLRHDREITPVVYPTRTGSVMKRLRDDDGDTPSKRSRLQDYSAHSFSTMEQKRLDYYSAGDSALLLKSPHVDRIPPRKPFKDPSSTVMNTTSGSLGDAFTPQSILKVRNLVRRSLTPENESQISGTSGNSTTPELLEEKLEEEKPTPSARQIRFSFPAPETSEEMSPPFTTTALDRASSSSRRIIGVTPRQALHSTPRKRAVELPDVLLRTVESNSDDSSRCSYPSSIDVEQEQTEEEELLVIEDTSLDKTENKESSRVSFKAGDSEQAICEEIVILDSDSDPGLEGRYSHTSDVRTVGVVDASFCERGENENTIGKSKSDNDTDLVANENVSTSSSLTHSKTSITKQDDEIQKSSRANELEVVKNVDQETYAKRLIMEESDDNEANTSHVAFKIPSDAEKLVHSANNDSVQVAENNEISMVAMNVENSEHVSAVTGTAPAEIMPISETVTNAIETRDAVDIKYELHGTVVKILSSALIDVDIALEGTGPSENRLGQSKLPEFDVGKDVIEPSKHKESATTDVNIPFQVSDNVLGKEIESVEKECIPVVRKSPELQDDSEKQPSLNVFATRSVKCDHAQLCQFVEGKVECASSEDLPEHETETRDIESQTSIRPFKDIECQTSFVFSGSSNVCRTLEDKCLQNDFVRSRESETISSQTEPQKLPDVIEKDNNHKSVSETSTVQNESASVDIIAKDALLEMSSRQSESLKCFGVVDGEHASRTIESLHDNTSKLSATVQSGDIPLKKDCKTASKMSCIESESFKNSDIPEVAEKIVITGTIPRKVRSRTSPNRNELSNVSDVLNEQISDSPRLSDVVDEQTSELSSPLGVTDEQIFKSVEVSYVVEDNTSKSVGASSSPSKIIEPPKLNVSVADDSLQKRKSIRRRNSDSHEHSLLSDVTEDKRTKRSKSDSSSTQSEPCGVLEDNIVQKETRPKNAKSSEATIETRSGTTSDSNSQHKISSISKPSHKKLVQSKRQNKYSKHSSSSIPENISEKIPLGTKLDMITEEQQVSSTANLQVDVVGVNQDNSIVTRSRKKASSVTSETSSVCDFKDSVGETWYGRTRKTSVSDSSKSTLIFGEASEELHDNLRSVKRKRRSSVSSNVSAVSDVTIDSKVGKGRSKKTTSSPDGVDQEKEQPIKTSEQSQQEVMEEYATARRLTRHQRSLLQQQSRHHRRQPGRAGVDSDESSDSSIAIRGCIPSSSVNQPHHTDVAAVMEHSTSALPVTPTKREVSVRRSRRSICKPSERHADSELSSPASVTSEMSTEYASSVTSTQSHLLHSPASIQSEDFVGRRRKSFQKAHRILMQSPAKARSLSGKDSSGSIEEEGLPAPGGSRRHSLRLSLGNDPQDPLLSSLAEPRTSVDVDDDSDAESVISQSSVVSVGGRRYSRYSLRSLDLDIQHLQKSPGSMPIDDKDESSPSAFSFSQPTVIPKAVAHETDEKSDPVPTFVFSPPQTRLQHSQSRSRSSNVRISQLAPTLQTIEEEEPSSSSSKASSAVEKPTSSTVTRSKKSRSKSGGSSSTASFHKRRSRAFNFFSPTSDKEKADADIPPHEETYRPTPTVTQRKRMTKMRSSREVYTALKVRKSFSVKPRRK